MRSRPRGVVSSVGTIPPDDADELKALGVAAVRPRSHDQRNRGLPPRRPLAVTRHTAVGRAAGDGWQATGSRVGRRGSGPARVASAEERLLDEAIREKRHENGQRQSEPPAEREVQRPVPKIQAVADLSEPAEPRAVDESREPPAGVQHACEHHDSCRDAEERQQIDGVPSAGQAQHRDRQAHRHEQRGW